MTASGMLGVLMTKHNLPINTEHYALGIGKDDKDRPVYQVTNVESGIVEYDDYILPRSIEALWNLTDKLNEAYEMISKDKAPLALVIKGEKDETGSIH